MIFFPNRDDFFVFFARFAPNFRLSSLKIFKDHKKYVLGAYKPYSPSIRGGVAGVHPNITHAQMPEFSPKLKKTRVLQIRFLE